MKVQRSFGGPRSASFRRSQSQTPNIAPRRHSVMASSAHHAGEGDGRSVLLGIPLDLEFDFLGAVLAFVFDAVVGSQRALSSVVLPPFSHALRGADALRIAIRGWSSRSLLDPRLISVIPAGIKELQLGADTRSRVPAPKHGLMLPWPGWLGGWRREAAAGAGHTSFRSASKDRAVHSMGVLPSG
jgi:hypothetical protein